VREIEREKERDRLRHQESGLEREVAAVATGVVRISCSKIANPTKKQILKKNKQKKANIH